jgi:UDP-2,4-diacetamido-2,4,6-trideoxy-beta-L-altropyranose hydrolase
MKVLIRCDASNDIGTGHLVRCLAVAVELKARGHQVEFASLELPGNRNDWIIDQGYPLVTDEARINGDASTLGLEGYDLALVDHYSLDQSYEKKLKKIARKTIALDDWGERVHDVDLIVDPSFSSASNVRSARNPGIPFESGPAWCLLRKEFSEVRKTVVPRNEFKKVLVFFGGTDPADQILPYFNEVALADSGLEFHFLIGAHHPRITELNQKSIPSWIKLHVSPASVAGLMAEMDLYLGSAGTVTWERMCLGLTGLIISIVDNQTDIASTLHQLKLHISLGSHEKISPRQALQRLTLELENPEHLAAMSQRCFDLIDGNGVQRICDRMESLI